VSQSYPQEATAPAAPGQQGTGAQMKRRNPVGAWLGLPIITLGIYGLVWYYKVHNELSKFDTRRPVSAGLALCSIIFGTITLGIWPLVTWVKLAGHIRGAQRVAGLEPSCSGGLGFLLGIIGFGVLYYQIELNKVVKQYGDAAPGTPVPLAA
jgi:hypothetical protein